MWNPTLPRYSAMCDAVTADVAKNGSEDGLAEQGKAPAAAQDLGLPPFRRWYRFGFPRNLVVLWKRNRVRYWPFRLRMAGQRALRGYADDQLWNLDVAVARLIVAGTGRMREWEHGYPGELTWEKWVEILRRIEDGFQAWTDEYGWFIDKPEQEAKYKDALALFCEWHGWLWD